MKDQDRPDAPGVPASRAPWRIGRAAATACIGMAIGAAAHAHDYRAGDVRVVHPFATPSVPSASTGAAYIATLENTGTRPDRLLRASTPLAGRVELHTMSIDAQGVMRMRMLDDIALAPTTPIRMRPGQGLHFMLIGLKQPLTEGQTFPMALEFERGGTLEVTVVVQVPKQRSGEHAPHKH
jgi:periplasmic copper chaperone A